MTPKFNKKAIMAYAHDLMKHTRGFTFAEALKSAWQAAKYIITWDLKWNNHYTCAFPLVVVDGVVWKPRQDALTAWLENYGAE